MNRTTSRILAKVSPVQTIDGIKLAHLPKATSEHRSLSISGWAVE